MKAALRELNCKGKTRPKLAWDTGWAALSIRTIADLVIAKSARAEKVRPMSKRKRELADTTALPNEAHVDAKRQLSSLP